MAKEKLHAWMMLSPYYREAHNHSMRWVGRFFVGMIILAVGGLLLLVTAVKCGF